MLSCWIRWNSTHWMFLPHLVTSNGGNVISWMALEKYALVWLLVSKLLRLQRWLSSVLTCHVLTAGSVCFLRRIVPFHHHCTHPVYFDNWILHRRRIEKLRKRVSIGFVCIILRYPMVLHCCLVTCQLPCLAHWNLYRHSLAMFNKIIIEW